MKKSKLIVIDYEVENQKVIKINAHYKNGESINIDEINNNYIGTKHTYKNMISLCDCYSVKTKTPNEYVVLDCDDDTRKEIEADMVKALMDL